MQSRGRVCRDVRSEALCCQAVKQVSLLPPTKVKEHLKKESQVVLLHFGLDALPYNIQGWNTLDEIFEIEVYESSS